MNNNLPQKYKDNFFNRILKKIKIIFSFKKNSIIEEKPKQADDKQDFIEGLKGDWDINNFDFEKKQLMDRIAKEPELLKYFSSDRLEVILQYYLNENEKKRKILNSLNS